MGTFLYSLTTKIADNLNKVACWASKSQMLGETPEPNGRKATFANKLVLLRIKKKIRAKLIETP